MPTKGMTDFRNKLQADLARETGLPPSYHDTEIEVRPEAVLTDPLGRNFYGGDYRSVRVFPHRTDLPGRIVKGLERVARRFERKKRSEVQELARALEKLGSRGRRNYGRDSAVPHLEPGANAREAIAELQSRASLSRSGHAWWKALWQYAVKFPRTAKVRDLDQRTLGKFLNQI